MPRTPVLCEIPGRRWKTTSPVEPRCREQLWRMRPRWCKSPQTQSGLSHRRGSCKGNQDV
eukprot:536938-Prorocentrum_lima.AAC.1